MHTPKHELLRRLALANKARQGKQKHGGTPETAEERSSSSGKLKEALSKTPQKPSKPLVAPEGDKPPVGRETPADGQRELAAKVAKQAMISGWEKAIQIHAYENRISEDQVRKILDEALEYNEKADPSGRIDELEDWAKEKQGRSTLVARAAL